jgi:hypothetical protein
MRNRAKCRLCNEIIESKHQHDYVTCSCGEISVDGGNTYHRAIFNDIKNFICLDDEGNEIIPKYEKSKTSSEQVMESAKMKPTREELLKELDEMIKSIEKLPPQALYAPVSHADFGSLLILIHAILRSE